MSKEGAPKFPEFQYGMHETDDDGEAYFPIYDSKQDAVSEYDNATGFVATYKLVKVERLALKRTVSVVKAK